MADTLYTRGLPLWGGLDDSNFWFMLVDSTYTPDPDDNFVSAAVSAELADVSYDRIALTGSSISYNDTLDRAIFSCNDVVWPSLAGAETVDHVILFKLISDDSDSVLMAAWDVAGTSNGQDMIFVVPAEGLMYVDQAA